MLDRIARHRRALFRLILMVGDVVLMGTAFATAFVVRFRAGTDSSLASAHTLSGALPLLIAVGPLWVALFHAMGLYVVRRTWRLPDLFFTCACAVSLGVLALVSLAYALKLFYLSRLLLVIFWGTALALAVVSRWSLRRAARWLFRRGIGLARIVLVGDGQVVAELEEQISADPGSGFQVVGRLVREAHPPPKPAAACHPGGGAAEAGRGEECAPAQGSAAQLFTRLLRSRPHLALFSAGQGASAEISDLMARCLEHGIEVGVVPDAFLRSGSQLELREVAGVPALRLRKLPLEGWERLLKRALDVGGALAALPLAAALMGACAAMTRRAGRPGPLIERAPQVGLNGRVFEALCLRLSALPPRWEAALRELSLERVPQLCNVLKGEMSLVGPSPEPPERVERYSPWQRRRLRVKPGITGLAQIRGTREEDPTRRKAFYDMRYIENQSVLLDIEILLRTPFALLWRARGQAGRGAPALAEPRAGRKRHAA